MKEAFALFFTHALPVPFSPHKEAAKQPLLHLNVERWPFIVG